MLTRSKEEVTLISKEELMTNTAPLMLVQHSIFDVSPVIRNMVEGEDASTRNTIIKRPFQPEIGFDLYYRFKIGTPKRMNQQEGFYIRSHHGSIPIGPRSEVEAYELLERLREDAVSTYEDRFVVNMAFEGTINSMLQFKQVFGRFPRDSEKVQLDLIKKPLADLFHAGIKTNYPMKHLKKFDKIFLDLLDYSKETFPLLFKIAAVTNNFDAFMSKIMKNINLLVIEKETDRQQRAFEMRAEHLLDPDSVEFNYQQNGINAIKQVADHVSLSMDVKQEAFFLKYFKFDRLHDLVTLTALVHEPTFPASGNWAVYKNYLQLTAALELKAEVVTRLEKKGFSWEQLTTLLPNTSITHSKLTVRMLDPQDATALALGQITHCCQGLHGAGESCMFEGLVNPYSGFLVFESDGQIIAQSWVWQSEDDTLVLDNIEFADFKNANSIIDGLIKWLEASPFENIQVGQGYMEIELNAPKVKSNMMSWYKQTVWKKNLYTDAQSRLWLKRLDQVVVSK